MKDEIDVFSFFNSSCYSGYGDDPGGFYAVYNRIFLNLSEADARVAESDKEEWNPPEFGEKIFIFHLSKYLPFILRKFKKCLRRCC